MTQSESAVQLALIDKNEIVRLGCRKVFEGDPRFEMVTEGATLSDLQATLEATSIIFLDPFYEACFDEEAVEQVHARFPSSVILVFTECTEPHMMATSFRSGARGYLLKSRTPGYCLPWLAWSVVTSPASLADSSLLKESLKQRERLYELNMRPVPLSSREREILRYLIQGPTDEQIAHELGVARTTVQSHVNSIFRKTGTNSRFELGMFVGSGGISLVS